MASPHPAVSSIARLRRRWKILISLLLLIGLLILLWDWNWFRPLVAGEASAALGRKVTLDRFDVHLGGRIGLEFDGLAVANPASFAPDSRLLRTQQLMLRIDPWALLHGTLDLTSIEIRQPRVDLRTDGDGKPNWTFAMPAGKGGGSPLKLKVGLLKIDDGLLRLKDPALKADFNVKFHTAPAPDSKDRQFLADADGRYAGQPITAHFVGGAVLSLRDASRPYPVNFSAVNGATRIKLNGSILRPMQLGGAQLKLSLRGNNLADLYPLTGIPLPATPPYKLDGKLDYADNNIRFRDFHGVVGSSDLSGDIAVDPHHARPQVTAHLLSKQVVMADLAGFIGATPGKQDAANTSAKLKQQQATQAARPRVLPDTPINLPKLRSADLDIHYRGQHIVGNAVPLDNLKAHLTIVDGKLSLNPLSFGVGKGSIVSHLTLDATAQPVQSAVDVDFRHVDLHKLLNGTSLFKGSGIVGGRLDLKTTGDSVAKMLGNGNGGFKLFMGGGDLSALLVDLAGLEFGKAVLSALGIPSRTHLRCLIADFGLTQGVLHTHSMLIDTQEANVVGKGTANFSKETLDYQLSTDPKHFSIGSLPAPIDIGGTFKDPSIKPDPTVLGTRAAAAAALGVVLTPLAALIPTIQLGLGENHDCKDLLDEIRKARNQGPGAVMKALPKPAGKSR